MVCYKVFYHRRCPIRIALFRRVNAVGKKTVEPHIGGLRIVKYVLHFTLLRKTQVTFRTQDMEREVQQLRAELATARGGAA